MELVEAKYKLFVSKKMSRDDFIKQLRMIFGDTSLRSTLTNLQSEVNDKFPFGNNAKQAPGRVEFGVNQENNELLFGYGIKQGAGKDQFEVDQALLGLHLPMYFIYRCRLKWFHHRDSSSIIARFGRSLRASSKGILGYTEGRASLMPRLDGFE
ncbi:hypothetical protein Vadar_004795 [Vaccinium darrowii]|uniref:Uncharacterized protein n=1 Tax=Vaccinium darrowii TaxID=229202 RepID=A0ACB7XWT6_9ERIC|nr:hypothetical protein Vadar_004795 [Vaccinium darrowii]